MNTSKDTLADTPGLNLGPMDVTDQPHSSGTYRGFLAARAGMPEWLPHLLVMVAGMAIVLFVGVAPGEPDEQEPGPEPEID